MTDLPWSNQAEEKIDLDSALEVLNEDHFDLEKVKERILEYLAVKSLKREFNEETLFFVFQVLQELERHRLEKVLLAQLGVHLFESVSVVLKMKLKFEDIEETLARCLEELFRH